jgi:RNA polymerase sigma-70 factor (ECF subfamily)
LCAFLRTRGVGPEDAEDIAQDCMERLIRYRAHSADELRLLLYRIARNRLADRGRSSQSRPHLSSPSMMAATSLPARRPIHCARPSPGRCCPCCGRPCSSCPSARAVYLLNRITGMSYTQIARHCGITAKTVEKHIARALQGLRQELGSDPLHNDRDNG